MRPFLPPLLAGALARGDLGVDFEGTDYSFLEEPAFLAGVLALAVLSYAAARAWRPEEAAEAPRALAIPLALLAVALGALLFAGSLAGEGHEGWPGLVAGAACAALGYAAGRALLRRAGRRLDGSAAALLPAWADLAALALAALAVLAPPVGLLTVAGLAWLLLASRRREGRKYEGLRVLR